MTLTKREIVKQIAHDTGIVQTDVFGVVQKTFEAITRTLAKGDRVELREFGVFKVRVTKPRVGRDPHRPEVDISIPRRAVVKFKAGKIMRERVLKLSARPMKAK